jgi:predicted RNA-binding Zn ribbon-like protein
MAAYESAFSRPPAPPPLDLVQAFINSVDLEDGIEEFATVESLRAWVATHVPSTGNAVSEADRLGAIRLREALRNVVEHGITGEAGRELQQELNTIPLILRVDTGGLPELVARQDDLDAVIAKVLAAVYQAMIDGTWNRLKICRNDVCRWAFYDASKNGSGVWCSMATCGSKAKARAYRRRMKKEAT